MVIRIKATLEIKGKIEHIQNSTRETVAEIEAVTIGIRYRPPRLKTLVDQFGWGNIDVGQ